MSKKTKSIVSLKKRAWLRPINSWGPESTVQYKVLATYDERYGSHIDGSFGIRDCHSGISLDLYSDSRKHAIYHLEMLCNLRTHLNKTIEALDTAIDKLDELGWKEVEK